jgi:hypothetical protein
MVKTLGTLMLWVVFAGLCLVALRVLFWGFALVF